MYYKNFLKQLSMDAIIFDAIAAQDCALLQSIIDHNNDLIATTDQNGVSLLMFACQHYDGPILNYLCKKSSFHINSEDEYGDTALIYAIRFGGYGAVTTLLEYGASISSSTKHEFDVLMESVISLDFAVFQKLLQSMHQHTDYSIAQNILRLILQLHQPEMLLCFLEKFPNIFTQDSSFLAELFLLNIKKPSTKQKQFACILLNQPAMNVNYCLNFNEDNLLLLKAIEAEIEDMALSIIRHRTFSQETLQRCMGHYALKYNCSLFFRIGFLGFDRLFEDLMKLEQQESQNAEYSNSKLSAEEAPDTTIFKRFEFFSISKNTGQKESLEDSKIKFR